MLKKLPFLITPLLIILAIVPCTQSAEQTVFGPKILRIGWWRFHISGYQFSIDEASDGRLVLFKNRPNRKIRGGFLLFNGRFIPIRKFLTGNQIVLEKDLNLQNKNRLIIFFRGTPRASLTIKIKKPSVVLPPEVNFAANPASIKRGDSSTLTWDVKNATSCIIAPGIGVVDLSGSHAVSPRKTTVYSLSATGPGGITTASATVVVWSLEDIDYGLNVDEQQGGGGLGGDGIRILNGNAVVFRTDLSFASPHKLGLSFAAAYNSRSDIKTSLGHGWSHSYSVTLDSAYKLAGETYLKVMDPTGRAAYFKEETTAIFRGAFHERTHVVANSGSYVWYRLDGTRYGFSDSGTLLWIEDENGNRLELGYDDQNQLERVYDPTSGRELAFNYNLMGLLVSISGPITAAVPDGIWVSYGYDENENLIAVAYADKSGLVYSYADPEDIHNLTEQRNAAGHLNNTWDYDDQDRCIENYSVNGTGVRVGYGSGDEIEVTDAYGVRRIYTLDQFDGRKRVTSMSGPGGAPYNNNYIAGWTYDSQMNLTAVETSGGTIHRYLDYDDRGNPATVILAAGTRHERKIRLTFHPELNVPLTRKEASVLGNGEKVTIWDYDDDYDGTPNEMPTGRITRLIEQGFAQDAAEVVIPYEYITTFTYNSKGQVLMIDGPLAGGNDAVYFSYANDSADLLSVTRPLIGESGFSDYNAAGQVGRMVDVNGRADRFSYDGKGRITAMVHEADASIRSFFYNLAGLMEMTTDEDSVSRYFDYEAVSGRLRQKSDMEGNVIRYRYDAPGNRIEMSKYDDDGNCTSRKRWSYQQPDIPGKLWREIRTDNTHKEYDYDKEGNIAAITDFEKHTTSYEYDPLNRLVKVIQPGNAITSYDYDAHGNLTSVTDAENHVTIFVYDDMARLVSASSPDSGPVSYVYDAAGNLTAKTDAKKNTIQYDYDLLNRLTAIRFPDSSQNIIYSYDNGIDGVGRRTGMRDPTGSVEFEYDARGRLIGKTSVVNGYRYPVNRTYSPGGRLSSFTYPSGRTIDYSRFITGKIRRVTTGSGSKMVELINHISYNPFGSPKGMETGAGGIINNVFSADCNCLEVINPGEPMERVYTYDANRNLISIQGTYSPWFNQTFSYDALNRLTSADGIYGRIEYSYDKVGNRLIRTSDDGTQSYTYVPGSNKLARITGPEEPIEYTYDANGNVTGMGDKTLIYNQGNRLIRVEKDGNIIGEYVYNGLGQRGIKEVNGETTVFHYDFDGNIIAESSLEGIFATEYLYVDQARLAMVDVAADTMYYYLNNYLGTPVMMTDDQNVIVWEAQYKPFGETAIHPNSEVINNLRFPGQYYDKETGLHYNYHRYYDSNTGRYLRPDPTGLAGGINLFTYSKSNPINWFDIDGAKPVFSSSICEDGKADPNTLLLELYGIDVSELKLKAVQQQMLLMSVLFPSSGFNVKASKGWLREKLGRPYPTKANRVGKLQPYNPKTGRFLSHKANPGFKYSPISRFAAGFGQGWGEAKGAGGATPIGRAGNIGYFIGRIMGNIF